MNGRFLRPVASPEDAHDPLGKTDLGEIMCMEYERSVGNDYIVRFQTHLFQIMKNGKPLSLPRPRDKVTVRVRLDGNIAILWKGTNLLVKELTNTQDNKPPKAA